MADQRHELTLWLYEDRSPYSSYYHVKAEIVALNESVHRYQLGDDITSIVVTCQCDSKPHVEYDPYYSYAWAVECYTGSGTSLAEARRIVKVLTPIERKLDQMSETRGPASDYGQYVGRVAEVLGIRTISYPTDYGRQTVKLADGIARIRAMLARWNEEHNPKAANVV